MILLLGWMPKLRVQEVPWYQNNDFAHYFITGDLVRKGINPYSVDLRPLYSDYGFAPDRMISKATNPPPLAYLTSWLTYVDPAIGFLIWTLLQIVALVIGILFSIRIAGLKLNAIESGILIIAGVAPLSFFSHLRFAQSQAIIMCLIAFSVFLMQRGGDSRKCLGAFVMGFASALKLFTLPIIVPIFSRLGLTGVVWFGLGFGIAWLPFFLAVGFGGIADFVAISLPYIGSVSHNFTGNIGLVGSVVNSARAFDYLSSIRPFIPLLNQLSILLLAMGLIYIFSKSIKRWSFEGGIFFVLGLCCLLSPVSWNHYLLLLIPGMIFMAQKVTTQDITGRDSMWLIITYLLLGSAVGLVKGSEPVGEIVSAWSAVFGIILYLKLIRDYSSIMPALKIDLK